MSEQPEYDLPLFPLRTVLFPGGILPLRIFEPRYVDMIRWCMREAKGFGVVLLREGSDVLDGNAADEAKRQGAHIFDIGTAAQIIDFDQADNGLLGIVAQGGEKFSVQSSYVETDGLMRARVRSLPEVAQPLPPGYESLVSVLKDLLTHPLIQELDPQVDFEQDSSVGHRLADLLPVAPELKQWLLEMSDAEQRLRELQDIIKQLAS
ncbi:MAG: peptidase S16 [Gammaproteobacteria bacterium]|nr:peptidase S16 [Gammaproteobacteria bacterium]